MGLCGFASAIEILHNRLDFRKLIGVRLLFGTRNASSFLQRITLFYKFNCETANKRRCMFYADLFISPTLHIKHYGYHTQTHTHTHTYTILVFSSTD